MNTELDATVRELEEVPFGRSRFMKLLGGAMFGVVTGTILKAAPAAATLPPGCGGFPECEYCSGRICSRYCRAPYATTCSWGNGQCWNTCNANGTIVRCCDWVDTRPDPDQACICWEYWGTRQCD